MNQPQIIDLESKKPLLINPDRPIYLDYQATTPVDPQVLEQMLPYLTHDFGNAASRSHAYGWTAEKAVEKARQQVADALHADPREIVWTSGATEATNLALKGAAHFYSGKGKHIITLRTEHKATLDTCRQLEREGFEVTYLEVQEDGLVDLKAFEAAIRPDTIIASVLFVNNEIGVIQPMEEIGRILRTHKVLFHVDAVQALGKIPVDVEAIQADMMSLSGHKIYGPKGIGALYVRRKPRVRVEAQVHGGGHERGMRSGTLPTHQIVGMGAAAELAVQLMESDGQRIRKLRDRLLKGIQDRVEETYINGSMEHRVPHNLNISFAFVEGESLIMALKEIAVSSGSACTSASLEPSYVLRALGKSDELAHSSIRFGIGRFTTEAEIDATIELIAGKVGKLRELSPLWEMHLEGIDLNSIQWAAH
ncbi:IscS subfamily cysteine desulfurase [Acidithiobacillus thiooxidans]|uniref:IscS subfamily cysteine desulfurase n=1 Tax=Acidithiobacillus thiooxidans TaxID=930 RepID=UPI0002625189|nr:IscS subfamily cysteine desulfurase [Acidithiobacillus thiooxidans]MBU2809942.1 IscS subfamily cysteine desulfurase [Acidithiobacillus thiooxidans]